MQYKLLIVDDDKALVKMLDNNFTIKNYDVRSAAIGEEASEFNKRKNFSLRDRNEEDFAATGIKEMSYNWLYMESWVALFAGCKLYFAFPCTVDRVIHDFIALYTFPRCKGRI